MKKDKKHKGKQVPEGAKGSKLWHFSQGTIDSNGGKKKKGMK